MKNVFIVDGERVHPVSTLKEDQQVIETDMPERLPVTDENRYKRQVLRYSEAEGIHFEFEEAANAARREAAYKTSRCITFAGHTITVDEANKLWLAYTIEKNAKADELAALIVAAKEDIRSRLPD